MESVYRGTSHDRFSDRFGDNGRMPRNWTDDPLQAVSYALIHTMNDGDTYPVLLETGQSDDFSEGVPGIETNYFPGIPDLQEREPSWYEFLGEDFDSTEERNRHVEVYSGEELEEFLQQEQTISDEQLQRVLESVEMVRGF